MKNKKNLLSKEKTTKQNRVWVRIASSCNNKCLFCLDSYAHNGTFTDSEKVKKQIKDGFKEGYENRVIISGGEASIDPKFAEYIRYSKEIGYDRVQTITNGNMFAIDSFCKKVFSAGLEEVTFSFHGHNSKLHDYLVGTPGAFNKSIKGLINLKKYYPHVIVNIDVVVNKVNVGFLPEIIKFFIKFGVYEYDILQIIPFGRGFEKYREQLFYNIGDYSDKLKETWELSRKYNMYMWTNRFPAEAFEGYEDLIQDPRKIKGEVMGEAYYFFDKFVKSNGKDKPDCFGAACDVCFQKQYCHDFLYKRGKQDLEKKEIIRGEEFPSDVYKKYGETSKDFINYLEKNKGLVNIPKCLGGSGIYENYDDIKDELKVEDYTYKYVKNLYRKKSLRCKECKYNDECEGIHINFIRSYGFKILKPIK